MINKVFGHKEWGDFIYKQQSYVKYKSIFYLIKDLPSFKDISKKIFISQINYGSFKIKRAIMTVCAGPRVYL